MCKEEVNGLEDSRSPAPWGYDNRCLILESYSVMTLGGGNCNLKGS